LCLRRRVRVNRKSKNPLLPSQYLLQPQLLLVLKTRERISEKEVLWYGSPSQRRLLRMSLLVSWERVIRKEMPPPSSLLPLLNSMLSMWLTRQQLRMSKTTAMMKRMIVKSYSGKLQMPARSKSIRLPLISHLVLRRRPYSNLLPMWLSRLINYRFHIKSLLSNRRLQLSNLNLRLLNPNIASNSLLITSKLYNNQLLPRLASARLQRLVLNYNISNHQHFTIRPNNRLHNNPHYQPSLPWCQLNSCTCHLASLKFNSPA
jgi:hypothetical protein